jgi:hypothetical protein
MTMLKLLFFWIKHQDQTLHEVGVTAKPLVQTTLVMINTLKEQNHIEETWATDNKEPDYFTITLETSSASKAFERVKTILTHIRGTMGVPLVYIIRHQLVPEYNDDGPPIEDEDTNIPPLTRRQLPATPS